MLKIAFLGESMLALFSLLIILIVPELSIAWLFLAEIIAELPEFEMVPMKPLIPFDFTFLMATPATIAPEF